jgi:hypothetical protein
VAAAGEEYKEKARARAEKQYEDLVKGLLRVGRKQDQGWTAKQNTFVGAPCDSVNVTSLRRIWSSFMFSSRSDKQ